jgi:hypothetical protein
MKKLSIICALVMVFGVSLVQAQQYEVAPAGGKAFTTTAGVAPNNTISLDIYLTSAGEPQNAGGAWLDFSGSTADIAYVSAGRAFEDGSEGVTGPWTNGAGALVNEPAGPGTVLLVVANLGGAPLDADGDLVVGTATLQNTGPNDATINITTVPAVATWTPLDDSDVTPGAIVISQICDCTTDIDCDDGLFCNGVETCDEPNCLCVPAVGPCDDGNICTLDCDEATGACLTDTCDTSQLTAPTDFCCQDADSPCRTGGADEQSICGAQFTLTKEDGFYQPAGEGEVVTVKNKVCLNNPSDLVGGIQFDICDTPDCLTCIDCELTERTVMFDCFVLELPNGCCRVIMICKNPGCAINPGECNIVTVVMQTTGNPECGQDCIVETIEGIVASDYDGFALAGSGVEGTLCPVVCGDVCPPASAPDVNDCGDGMVDIYDIMCEVDLALTATPLDTCNTPRADVPTGTPPNCVAPDGDVNILDIMVLIDMALSRQDCCSFFYTGLIY